MKRDVKHFKSKKIFSEIATISEASDKSHLFTNYNIIKAKSTIKYLLKITFENNL